MLRKAAEVELRGSGRSRMLACHCRRVAASGLVDYLVQLLRVELLLQLVLLDGAEPGAAASVVALVGGWEGKVPSPHRRAYA